MTAYINIYGLGKVLWLPGHFGDRLVALIYTIGHEKNYLASIAANGPIKKLGRDGASSHKPKDYPGGYAFKTIGEAQRRIDEGYPTRGFAVFGLEADWGKDTVPSKTGWWHHLINDSEIVPL